MVQLTHQALTVRDALRNKSASLKHTYIYTSHNQKHYQTTSSAISLPSWVLTSSPGNNDSLLTAQQSTQN